MPYSNYQCDIHTIGNAGRGVTTWELSPSSSPSSPFTIPAATGTTYHSSTFTFTCTFPQCWTHQDNCNVTFYAQANQNLSNDLSNDVFLGNALNETPNPNLGGFWLSGAAGHGGWQTTDVSQLNTYNDIAENTFILTNYSTVDIAINYFRILRVYSMEPLGYNTADCMSGTTTSNGNIDSVRVDEPCNYANCGEWSYTYYNDYSWANSTIQPGGTMTWTFDWSNYSSYDYEHGVKCLFNFNNIWAATRDTNHPDVKLDAYINGQYLTSYYISNQATQGGYNHSQFPSFDLMLNNTAYNDTGSNTVQLVNNGYVPIVTSNDGINVYRIYQTYSPCGAYTDAHSDHSDNPYTDNPYSDHSDVPPGYYTVTVSTASETYGYVQAGIYLDGNNVGYGFAQFQVVAGSQHSITFDEYVTYTISDEGFTSVLDYVDDGGSGYNTNGGYINQDTTLTAYYTP